MTEYEDYNFDDDEDDEEEEFEKKIYIDDDDDDEEDEDEGDVEYDEKRLEYSQNSQEYEEGEETLDSSNTIAEEEEQNVSDYEEEEKQQPKKKAAPKRRSSKNSTIVEPPKKKPRKSSIDSVQKPTPSETPIKMPTIPETSALLLFNGIPTAQENLKKKQINQWCYICPLCSKTAYNKQTFERHLLLHDDFLTVLQVYYSEEDPVQCLNAAMEEWKVVETEYLKQHIDPVPIKQNAAKKNVILFKNKYYEYEAGKQMIYRKNAMDSLNARKSNFTAEERLKWKVFDEMLKIDKSKK